MKRMRVVVPRPVHLLGLAATLLVGLAIAQDEERPKPVPPKAPATAEEDAAKPDAEDTKPATKAAPGTPEKNAPANARTPSRTNRNSQPGAEGQQEGQRAAQRAALGANFDAQGDQGLRVTTIEQGGIFAQSGLRQNDRIVSVNGQAFTHPRQFEAFLWSQSGQSVPIIIERGGQRYTIQVNVPDSTEDSGWLGVYLDEGDPMEKGARVSQIYPSGPASRAGIQLGDVITQINKQPVEGSADAVMTIRELPAQSKIELAIVRDKEQLTIPVTLASRRTSGYQSFQGGYQQQPGQFAGQQGDGQEQQFGGQNQFEGVPPYAMQLEHDRRNGEQHERIEEEIRMLREEVRKLRELLEKK